MADLIKSGAVGFGIKEVADVAFYEVALWINSVMPLALVLAKTC